MYRVYEGRIVQARVIAVAEKVVRVEVFGVEPPFLPVTLPGTGLVTPMSVFRRRRGAGPYSQRAAQQSGGLGHQG